jgi:hypothetical protein
MSMWLSLARISPGVFETLGSRHELIGPVLTDPDVLTALDPAASPADLVGYQLEVVIELAEAHAGGEPGSFWTQGTWLARAVGVGAEPFHSDGAHAPVWHLIPSAVREVAQGLAIEANAATGAGSYAALLRAFAAFYATAAGEGRTVLGRVA